MSQLLEINLCPGEPRASIDMDIERDSELARDLLDCTASGDVEPACEYVRVTHQIRFTVWDPVAKEHREAIFGDLWATARAIYPDSESDFNDEDTLARYLIWEAASNFEQESDS